jgi:dephospho-CoA kinase
VHQPIYQLKPCVYIQQKTHPSHKVQPIPQAMLTRPFTRLVVAFGVRRVSQRRLVEECVLGLLILIPFGFIVGLLTSRLCTKIHFNAIRSDIWTTVVVFLVGDVLMEWLLPSLSCLPMAGDGLDGNGTIREDEYYYTISWLLQSFGLVCPTDFASTESLLSPDATAVLFSIRLVFLCIGVHIGESICWIALTGGIATGKTTVGRLLVDCEVVETDDDDDDNDEFTSSNTTSNKTKKKPSRNSGGNKRKSKKGGGSGGGGGGNDRNDNDLMGVGDGNGDDDDDGFKEGTVKLICADSIAHEVILPPQILAAGSFRAVTDHGGGGADENSNNNDNKTPSGGGGGTTTTSNSHIEDTTAIDGLLDDDEDDEFIVRPQDSVYGDILDAFDGYNIISSTDGICIDRLKLGSIIFNSKAERKKLNAITHPRILYILVRQLLKSVFFGNTDITIADLPLLFESGRLSWLFAATICVTVKDPAVQLDRLMKRNPELTKEECQARIDSQMPLKKKEAMADIVIDNSGDLEELSKQVEEVRRDLMGRIYGIGMSLLQMLLLIGGSTSIAVSSKFYTHWQE